MTHREGVERFVAEMRGKGVGPLTSAPPIYRLLWVAAVMVGSVATLPLVWSFADITNALMALPNLISLLVLNNVIILETKKYLWDLPPAPSSSKIIP